ncbi:phage regulatory CII family protein [Psychromonas hadalis]|uniref:phage regulatory CII family protein n=1 Tax=Psychromonas hadalis TaxID=211669 RepID=UPI0003B6BBD6|nr:phage regulatory CII family protein [Psychromonas hadalis]
MECLNETGGFRENAQQKYDDACNAFSASQNLAQVERFTGVKKLKDKLNPSQSHKLSAFELKLITKASGDYTIIHSMLLSLDMVAVNVNRDGDKMTLVHRALTHSKNAGDLASLTLENGGEIRLPRRKARQLLDTVNAGIANLVLLANDLENRTSGVTPFLSMGVDFVVQNGGAGLM